MQGFTPLLVALLATVALSTFVPVPNYDLSQIEGTWYIQSTYDTAGNNWGLFYCGELTFDIINSSVVTMTIFGFDGGKDQLMNDTNTFYPDASNPAILYQDAEHKLAPLQVVNVSSLPYWVDGTTPTSIFAFNYTGNDGNPEYIIMACSKWYDTMYDMRPFLAANKIPVTNNVNFWFINSACDTHFGWTPFPSFKADSLLKNWNLIAVYDPAGTGIVPWYTGSGIYDWTQAYCGKVAFTTGEVSDTQMTMTLKSLYQGSFMRSWQVHSTPQVSAALMGFNIDANTLLYVQYADLAGNLILTAGTTTSFFLSTSASSLTTVERGIFEVALKAMGFSVNFDYIYAIDGTSC